MPLVRVTLPRFNDTFRLAFATWKVPVTELSSPAAKTVTVPHGAMELLTYS